MIRGTIAVLLLLAIAVFALSDPGATRIVRQEGEGLRIVTMAPAFTEILLYLGLGEHDRIVGVSVWDEQLPDVPRIGDIDKPDLERIFTLEPDLVLGLESRTQASFFQVLEERGLRVEVRRVETIDDIRRTVDEFGEWLGARSRAREFSRRLQEQLASAPAVDADSPRVLFVIDHDPLWVAGSDTFVHTMLGAVGVVNLFEDRSGYFQVALEEVVIRQPDVIIDVSIDPAHEQAGLARWSGFARHLEAVAAGRVHAFPNVRPSVRVCDWIDLLGDLVRDTRRKR